MDAIFSALDARVRQHISEYHWVWSELKGELESREKKEREEGGEKETEKAG